MSLLSLFFAAVTGYLLGSISLSRLISYWKKPGETFPMMRVKLPGTDIDFISDSSGATTIFYTLGPKWGGITALFDILKTLLPTLAFRLFFPGNYLYLVVGLFSIIGDCYPIYHRFKGGRGASTISGVLLVVDFTGTIMMGPLGLFLGFVTEHVSTARWLGRVLMIPYFWITYNNAWLVIFIILVNLLFFISMSDEIKQMYILKKMAYYPSQISSLS